MHPGPGTGPDGCLVPHSFDDPEGWHAFDDDMESLEDSQCMHSNGDGSPHTISHAAEVPTTICSSGTVGSAVLQPRVHPADEGLDHHQVHMWRRAEQLLQLPLLSQLSNMHRTKAAKPPLVTDGSCFVESATFRGPRDGFCFGTSSQGTGYYRDWRSMPPAVSNAAGATPLCLFSSVTPSSHIPATGEASRAGRARSRRIRKQTGTRQRWRRRVPGLHHDEVSRIQEHGCVPQQSTLADVWWKPLGLWAFDTVNPNSWNSGLATVLASSSADCVFMQETKRLLSDDDPSALNRSARRAGWSACAWSARQNPSGQASGGVAVMARRGIGICPHSVVKEDCQYRQGFVHINGCCPGGIHCGSVWMKDSQGLSDTNLQLLASLASSIGRLRGPWLLGGDWNMAPSTLQSSGWLSIVDGVVVATALPTCNSSVYDYFVVSRGLLPAVVGIQRIDDAGLCPHWPTRLLLRGDARRFSTRQLVRPEHVQPHLPVGPLPQQDAVPAEGIHTQQQLDASALEWHSAARGEWASLTGNLDAFHTPRFRWVSAPGPRALAFPDSQRAAFQWRQLAMRFSELVEVACGNRCSPTIAASILRRHVRKAHQLVRSVVNRQGREAALAMTWWLDVTLSAVFARCFDQVHSLVCIARDKAVCLDVAARSDAIKEWQRWVRGSDSQSSNLARSTCWKPTKRAFLYVRGSTGWVKSPKGDPMYEEGCVAEEDLTGEQYEVDDLVCRTGRVWQPRDHSLVADVPLCDQAAVELEADAWGTQWNECGTYQARVDVTHSMPPAALQVSMVRKAAMSFPAHTGLGADNIAPRAVARLSDRLIEWLIVIFHAAERLGSWPAALRLVVIVLLPKPDGGRRPIGLFATLVRIWMRCRSYIARTWEAANELPCFFGGPGRGAQRAAWMVAFNAESAARQKMFYAQTLLDLVKAFERLPHHLIVAAARSLNYCLFTLRLSLAAYRLPRVLGADGAFSRMLIATRGITAGSGFATTELRILLHNVVVGTMRAWPMIRITLYVDDATLEVHHSSMRVTQSTIAGATDCMVDMLQVGLGLECSAKKSGVVGSTPGIASRAAAASRTRMLTPWRNAKLLGTSSGGGRRRCVKHSKVRLKVFDKRASRIRRLRKSGVDTIQVVRAAGTPMLTYGVEVHGMSCTQLQIARRAIAKAVAAEAGGKCYELVLHVADGAKGTLDPAFDAHGLPIRMWAMALWEEWVPPQQMDEALRHASRFALTGDGSAIWSRVAGPAAAVAASASRIGWTFHSGHLLCTDQNYMFNLFLDPPQVILQEVHRAVRRWRLARIGHMFPALIPSQPDVIVKCDRSGAAPAGVATTLFSFADTLDGLLRQGSCKFFDAWEPRHGAYLRSAIAGGQWVQTRIAAVPGWSDDTRCQLCLGATGTLSHRLVCPALVPPGGWQRPPPECDHVAAGISPARLELLGTRGLFVFSVQAPLAPAQESFTWLWPLPEELPDGVRFFIDGSLFDESRRWARRTGFGVAVVSEAGSLLAFGNGIPPPWIVDAAGAELWAFYFVAALTPCLPAIVTDCKGILDGLQASPPHMCSSRMALARTWKMVVQALDGSFEAAQQRVTWMPAHGSAASIGDARDSNGKCIDAVMWRANRLVDVLAKRAAARSRLPAWAIGHVKDAGKLYAHHAARLGSVTHDANNYRQKLINEDGQEVTRMLRDSTAARPWISRKFLRPPPDLPSNHAMPQTCASVVLGSTGCGERCNGPAKVSGGGRPASVPPSDYARYRRNSAQVELHQLRNDARAEASVARWAATLELQPCTGVTGAERLSNLRARVAARAQAKQRDA